MSELPLVSCLIVTYNFAEYLPRALDSALAQDYPANRLEIVVVDDGSTDGTEEAVAPYLERVRYIRKPNGGLNSAINRALAEAHGDLIALLSGDDEWPPDRVRKQVDFLASRPEVGLVYGDLELIDGDGRVVAPSFWRVEGITPRRGRVLGALLKGNFVSGGGLMVRSDLRSRFHPLPAEIAWEDWWIALRVAEVAEVDYLDEPVYRYRRHGRNMNLGVPAERRGSLLAAEVPIRRFALRNCLAAASATEALEGYRELEAVLQRAARLLGKEHRELVHVTAQDEEASASACEQACAAWREGDRDGAIRSFVSALAADPFDDLPRSLLGALLRGFTWPERKPRGGGHAPLVSIVIPVFNKLELTRQCLRAIALTAADVPHEVIVVDDGSTDGTAGFLNAEETAGRLRAVAGSQNAGFGAACNRGAELAYGEHVLFLNNDTIPLPGWLEAMLDAVQTDPEVGAVGARLLYPDWTIQHAGIAFSEQSTPFHTHRGAAMDDPAVLDARDVPAVTGACLLVRSHLLLQLGGFSSAYRMYVEDVDLCFAVWAAGYRVRYCPEAVLLHLENASMASVAWRDSLVRAGWATLRSRWAGRLPARVAVHCGPAFAPVRMRRRMQGARAFVGLAFADELVEQPELLRAYAQVFDGSDDATLVVSSPGSVERLAALVEELGLDGEECADLLAVGAETSLDELAATVDYMLTRQAPPPPLAHLPCYDERTIEALRTQASAQGVAA
jgi:GT2 family glycosyltransferase